jgi:uncharacterized protein YndB with AHSA1/START domain/DNA-binding transcriptional ArsR family regulator
MATASFCRRRRPVSEAGGPPADVFGAIAKPVRRALLDSLRTGPQPVHELAAAFAISRPAVSQHLRVLRDADLVVQEKLDGQRRYRLDPGPPRQVEVWVAHYERFWRDRLLALHEVLARTTKREGLHLYRNLPAASPEKVWRALIDPDVLSRWLMPNDFQSRVGHRFTFRTDPVPGAGFDGVIQCEVLALDPLQLLRISWVTANGIDTTVTWRLAPEGKGTRLFLIHEGFDETDPQQYAVQHILDGGWRSHIARRLENILAALE